MCLNIETPKNINFPLETNGKLMVLGVPILKHFRVLMHVFSKLFAVFLAASFLHMSQLRVPVPELGISSSKPFRKFKSPSISMMIVNGGGNKLFLMCKSIFSNGSRAKLSKSMDIILQESTLALFWGNWM